MPVTPFHFGPGLLLKAAAPGSVSLTAFVAANVAIDVESVSNLLLGRYPVHAALHTFAGASAVGVAVGVVVWALGRVRRRDASPERARGPAVLGGWLGGVSHALLDGVMHGDARPFLPFSEANPLHRLVGLDPLHLVCVGTGVVGLVWLGLRGDRLHRTQTGLPRTRR